ncbi:hypothetical protein FGBNBECL_00011 [Enterococcus phage vB_OCPT_Bob]|uniref:Uncharacterized protein n=1 Tax=Enterococcus phage vB_OCPT_Bob TaxID=2922318 RepID=A0A9E7J1V7_9CAUD|nr:hypothetical protein FGBNBECL_00011 [Enterococcus phage vB_OCPT_Bob]
MYEYLKERETELVLEQMEACERLSIELSRQEVDQITVTLIAQRIERISGRIEEVKQLVRYAGRRSL